MMRIKVWLEDANRLFHGASGLYNLRQKHLSFSEEFTYTVHCFHQRPLNDFYSRLLLLKVLKYSCLKVLCHSLHNHLAEG